MLDLFMFSCQSTILFALDEIVLGSVLFDDPIVALIAAICLGLIFLLILVILNPMPMPGVRCPHCAKQGIEQWVLPGKHCPRCATPC